MYISLSNWQINYLLNKHELLVKVANALSYTPDNLINRFNRGYLLDEEQYEVANEIIEAYRTAHSLASPMEEQ